MYSINGFSLHQPTSALGWAVTRATDWSVATERESNAFSVAGFDGLLGSDQLVDTQTAPTLTIVMTAPSSSIAKLRLLIRSKPLVLADRRGFDWNVTLSTMIEKPESLGKTPVFEVKIILVLPTINGRATEDTTTTPLDAATKTVTVWPGLTGWVDDAILRVAGPFSGLQAKDSGGSSVGYQPAVAAGSYLRIDCRLGRAWITTSDTWSGGTEVTYDLVNGPGPQTFRIAASPNADLSSRGRISVYTFTRGEGAEFTVRGRAAHNL